MKNQQRQTVAASFLLGLISIASAEPDANVKSLMNEPMTLWDKGMMELDKRLDFRELGDFPSISPIILGFTEHESDRVSARADYDWDRNRILVMAHLVLGGLPDRDHIHSAICRYAIYDLRMAFDMQDADTLFFAAHYIGAFFSHRTSSSREKLGEKLIALLEFETYVVDRSNSGRSVQCRSRAIEKDIYVAPID